MTAAPGIVTSGTGPPNAVVQVQPGMNVQPVVLVDANGQYVTTSGSAATAGYLADLTGSVNVSQAAAPTTGQVLTATSGTTATWQSGSTETAGYLATQTTSVYVAGGSAPTAGMELVATSGSAATWQFGASGILTTLGDMLFENSTPALARLAGNTSAAKMFLTQTGNGGTSAAPAWGTIATTDVPAVISQCGQAMLNLGWLGATCDFLQTQITAPPATTWGAGTIYLARIDAVPGAAANGSVSFSWFHHASMANSYIGLYNSSGTRLGVTADLSATGSGPQRVACTGFGTVPSNGILYAAYLNGTSGVAGGPYLIENVPWVWTAALSQPGGAAPWYSSELGGTATSLPSSLTLSNFTTVYALTVAIAVD